jgi:thiosulfate dehydrogenase
MKPLPAAILAFVLGLLILPAAVFLYFLYGNVPVATADTPFPLEAKIVKIPLNARIHRDMPKQAPFATTPETLVAGAHLYREQCASCHGLKDHPSVFGATMFPRTPQLWAQHKGSAVVGVSDDPAGETFWKIQNGIRLSGMPAYKTLLSDQQMWQIALLLAAADKPLPEAATQSITSPISY